MTLHGGAAWTAGHADQTVELAGGGLADRRPVPLDQSFQTSARPLQPELQSRRYRTRRCSNGGKSQNRASGSAGARGHLVRINLFRRVMCRT